MSNISNKIKLGADQLTFEGGGRGGGDLLLAGNFFSGIVMCKIFFSYPSPCTSFFFHSLFRSIFFSIAYTI